MFLVKQYKRKDHQRHVVGMETEMNIMLFCIHQNVCDDTYVPTKVVPIVRLFRTSHAREAILENTLLKKRPGARIQQQPLLFMVEFSTGSAEEPTFGMASAKRQNEHSQPNDFCKFP